MTDTRPSLAEREEEDRQDLNAWLAGMMATIVALVGVAILVSRW